VRVTGIVIIVGAVLFMCAVFTPVCFRVFTENSATRRLEVIRASPSAWSVARSWSD
jgi:hypothetical protein